MRFNIIEFDIDVDNRENTIEFPGMTILQYLSQFIENDKLLYCGSYEDVDNQTENDYKFHVDYGKYDTIYDESTIEFEYIQGPLNPSSKVPCHVDKLILNLPNVDYAFIKKLIDTSTKFCENRYGKKHTNKIDINMFDSNCKSWLHFSTQNKRSLESLHIDDKIKKDLVNDLQKFLGREKFYTENSIPYKRIYMLEGIPGTGKTSLIHAIASFFNKSICILQFDTKINDTIFFRSLTKMKNDSILVLEDIDCLFASRKTADESKNMITFSGLLNGLDGFGKKEPLIIFMTTNHKDQLDDAIKRPGRVDKIIHFDYMKDKQIRDMFKRLVGSQIEHLDEFVKKIRNKKITPALLQKFFVDKLDCVNIMDELDYFEELYIEYKEKNNANTMFL